MKRHEQRKLALQALFALEFNPMDIDETIQNVVEEFADQKEREWSFLKRLVYGVMENREQLNQMLSPHAEEWSVERIFSVDRILCQMALFEMYCEEEPLSPGIAINEAIELAKEFGEDDSPRFINGILGAVVKNNEKSISRN